MQDMLDLKTRINRLFEELLARTEPGEVPAAGGEWTPRVDLYELPDRVVLRADVPGVSPGDLDVRLENGQLLLRGTRRQPQDLDPGALCRLERPFGPFVRRYALPDSVDPEQVRASCAQGVLEVVIGKRETGGFRRIPVQAD
ncbi:MAG: Hsp20/alpha crystallin family protein [Acidobacteria bacterium]|nr:Hsp20/alpha crystallin family protein [Acidobacteriota bacterium]